MADFRFTCSHCGQDIECDELWSGHQIQCPTCQTELTVPPKPDAPPHANLAAAQPGQPRLSIGGSRSERSAAPPPPPPQMATLQQQLNRAKLAKKGNPMKWVGIAAGVIVLGVAAYFGYGYFREWQAKRADAAKQANAAQAATNAAPTESATPAPPKELPLLPAVWTLDVTQAKIPEGRANGSVAGTNFVVEAARLDKVGTAYLLRLLQGTLKSPELGVMIYLHPNAGESVTGNTCTVSQDAKGKNVPQIVKLWKPNPRYQAQQKPFYSGYAMQLELSEITNGVVSGKIYLALPDTEQSVIAGVFKADTSLGTAVAGAPANPPAAVPTAVPAEQNAAFQKRYGKRH